MLFQSQTTEITTKMSTWYYYNEKGDKIEVSGGRLKGLAKAGLITPETVVETEDGKKARAGKVKGLTFPELSVDTSLISPDEKNVVAPATEETYGIKLPPPKPSPFTASMPEAVDTSVTDMSATASPFTAPLSTAATTTAPPVTTEPMAENPFAIPVSATASVVTPPEPENPFAASVPAMPEPVDNPFTAPSPLTQPTQSAFVPPTVANVFCTNCGSPVSEQAVACMSCGVKPVGHKKFCRQCGIALNPEQVICTKCGAAISAVGTTQSEGVGEILANRHLWGFFVIGWGRLSLTPDALIFKPHLLFSWGFTTLTIPFEQCVSVTTCHWLVFPGLKVVTQRGTENFCVFGKQQAWLEKIQQAISLKRR